MKIKQGVKINNLNSDKKFKQILVNSSKCDNVFETLDTNNPYKLASITFSILCIICVTPAFYSFIWYERFGSDKKEQLLTSFCLQFAGMPLV